MVSVQRLCLAFALAPAASEALGLSAAAAKTTTTTPPSTGVCWSFTTDCYDLCAKGLGYKYLSPSYNDCYQTCWVHSIETKKPNGKPQGEYPQKCMQEYSYCGVKDSGKKSGKNKGGKGGSLLARLHAIRRHQSPGYDRPPYDGSECPRKCVGWTENCAPPKAPLTTKQAKHCKPKSSSYYCAELCHNLFHSVMSSEGGHPGTQNCCQYSCPNKEKCEEHCNENWETGMKPIYDKFSECQKKNGYEQYPKGLLQEAAEVEEELADDGEPEAVDVGAFIQTSMANSRTEEL